MPNKLQIEQPKEEKLEKDERKALSILIKEQVIHALGKPIDLRDVQVRKVWKDHYRVNVIVIVGESAGSVSLAHSFFLVIDSEGKVIASTPMITKQY